ncbi:isoprenylcysteine carboxyl methyltransferase family protein [Streptomyces stramineus]|uniref:Isoprenylcysteine carboxylmethyltransferase family protein n=1 Tax=Streptomyces stramineus TaxID=173861 RepID=A0ABN0ZXL2_9ACTN
MLWYPALMLAVAAERAGELLLARRNARWSRARGGAPADHGHYRWMVALHTGLLVACPLEALVTGRPVPPVLAWAMFAAVLAAQALRWWCISTLGRQWNTRVIVVPGLRPVTTGPYRWLRHPNYAAVAAEGVALPLVGGAWVTALVFTLLNAWLLTVRIRCEDAALASAATGART